MSLDLYIKSNTPVLHRGTGIFIREDGETKELKTKEEVLKYFQANPEDIEETSYEDHIYFHINITHNLTNMASRCKTMGLCINYNPDKKDILTLYDLLWHPKDNLNIEVPTLEYLTDIITCYKKLLECPEYFKKYNPENGWGTYEQLVKRTKEYIIALTKISDNFKNYKIKASV